MLLAAYAESMTAVPAPAGQTRIAVSVGATIETTTEHGLNVVSASVPAGQSLMFSLETPLGDAEGFWHPNARGDRTLPADWAGSDTLSLVSSTPVGVLYDKAGDAVLGYACSETVDEITLRFGVCEETNTFVVHLELAPRATERTAQLALETRKAPWTTVLASLRDWLTTELDIQPAPVPAAALEPVYSSWYAFSQDVDAASIEVEASLARTLGCASVFIDDGWAQYASGRGYAGCGDWLPDLDKFPDLAGHVLRLHDLGMSVVLWVAPLLLGRTSEAFSTLASYAPHHVERLEASILDPRSPEVRDFVVTSCVRLMRDYGLDGLKIDFLDQATVYSGTDSQGDTDDTGEAMRMLLQELRDGLRAGGWQAPLLEFRQPYVSPTLAPYSNIVRVGDCPADTAVNRAGVVDLRLLGFGPVVHSDMLMWDGTADVETGVRQLLNVFFSVPQISMRLSELPADQLRSLALAMQQWRAVREVLLAGELTVGLPNDGYPVIQSWSADGQGVLGVYADSWVRLDLTGRRALTVLNGTRTDFVVLDLAAPAAEVHVEAFNAHGTPVSRYDGPWAEGLVRVLVPACGIARVHLR